MFSLFCAILFVYFLVLRYSEFSVPGHGHLRQIKHTGELKLLAKYYSYFSSVLFNCFKLAFVLSFLALANTLCFPHFPFDANQTAFDQVRFSRLDSPVQVSPLYLVFSPFLYFR
ncbi:hypothetical protein GMDG_03171 [Pseudogymnoascus destructans 20631-21]|uniref:Uncharacterized protein n=1 Tax=Pseudogymnoascus destructans (strain ATCC MYA-4855 / 20631-21) TaxID=658429 RepID=L8G5H7_PSED2|nr:hypothetical protein GMDG_03171 [Pseudogymnoascus destructans 20631-21]